MQNFLRRRTSPALSAQSDPPSPSLLSDQTFLPPPFLPRQRHDTSLEAARQLAVAVKCSRCPLISSDRHHDPYASFFLYLRARAPTSELPADTPPLSLSTTAGGNQRDLARAKAEKKKQDANKGKREPGGPSLIARREADAAALQAKIAVRMPRLRIRSVSGEGSLMLGDGACTGQAGGEGRKRRRDECRGRRSSEEVTPRPPSTSSVGSDPS